MKLAVIETGGKQYLVRPGDKLRIEKTAKPQRGKILNFDKVLLSVKEEKIKLGSPYIKDSKIKAEWLAEAKAKKIMVRKYKSKTRYRKTQGHRQPYTEVLIKDF
jgi:large subunit ribosomal protein L21